MGQLGQTGRLGLATNRSTREERSLGRQTQTTHALPASRGEPAGRRNLPPEHQHEAGRQRPSDGGSRVPIGQCATRDKVSEHFSKNDKVSEDFRTFFLRRERTPPYGGPTLVSAVWTLFPSKRKISRFFKVLRTRAGMGKSLKKGPNDVCASWACIPENAGPLAWRPLFPKTGFLISFRALFFHL